MEQSIDTVDPKQKNFFKRIDSTQRKVLIALLFSQFSSMMMLSIIGPFFPLEAERKGMTQSMYGLIFAEYGIVQLFFAPIIGKYIVPRIGAKSTIMCGLSMTGVAMITFGLSKYIDHLQFFIVICFVSRFFQSFGTSMYFNGLMTLFVKVFPNDIGVVVVSLVI